MGLFIKATRGQKMVVKELTRGETREVERFVGWRRSGKWKKIKASWYRSLEVRPVTLSDRSNLRTVRRLIKSGEWRVALNYLKRRRMRSLEAKKRRNFLGF